MTEVQSVQVSHVMVGECYMPIHITTRPSLHLLAAHVFVFVRYWYSPVFHIDY